MTTERIVLIGAGNAAHHLAPALLNAGLNLCQIYSRSIESARELGKKTGITYTADLFAVYPDCDVYIFCVSDDVLPSLFKSLHINKKALVLHTSGSVPLSVFSSVFENYGVLYPLQTFSKKRALNFREVPLCVEASNEFSRKAVLSLAEKLSERVQEISSDKRKKLHLAAVFANNFTNHLYGMAGKMLEEEGLDFSLLRPLIFETAHKVMLLSPEEAQTGPARRGDENILSMHKSLLKNDKKRLTLYMLLSDSIKETLVKNEPKPTGENQPMTLTLW
ncbi:MAG: DUF2520 domain-containing protein [Odoribacter sp.]|nr:DUF2520 domain-containing protein [Odoribacter sp.]